jgi:putative phosphoribosyl transferase
MQYFQKIFQNHSEAGVYLAKKLLPFKHSKPIILALPREGVPVAARVAQLLEAPLDVVVSRTLRAPQNNKVIFGAIAAGDIVVIDRSVQMSLALTDAEINTFIEQERKELANDMIRFNSGAHVERYNAPDTLIVVDDGLADGVTIRAGIEAAKVLYNPRTIIFASPVCSRDVSGMIEELVDDVITINRPQHMLAISNWYDTYSRVTEQEVRAFLEKFNAPKVSLFTRLGIV